MYLSVKLFVNLKIVVNYIFSILISRDSNLKYSKFSLYDL